MTPRELSEHERDVERRGRRRGDEQEARRELAEGEHYFQVPATVVVIAENADEARRYVGDLLREDADGEYESTVQVTVGTPVGVRRAS